MSQRIKTIGRVRRIRKKTVEVVNIFCRCQGLGVPRLVLRIVGDETRNRELFVTKCDM